MSPRSSTRVWSVRPVPRGRAALVVLQARQEPLVRLERLLVSLGLLDPQGLQGQPELPERRVTLGLPVRVLQDRRERRVQQDTQVQPGLPELRAQLAELDLQVRQVLEARLEARVLLERLEALDPQDRQELQELRERLAQPLVSPDRPDPQVQRSGE